MYEDIKVTQDASCPPTLIHATRSLERITASLSGEAEKWVSMATVPLARELACIHACQHSYEVFHQWLKWAELSLKCYLQQRYSNYLSFHSLDKLLLNEVGGLEVKANTPSFFLVVISPCPSKHYFLTFSDTNKPLPRQQYWMKERYMEEKKVIWDLKVLMESSLHSEDHWTQHQLKDACVPFSASTVMCRSRIFTLWPQYLGDDS